MNYTDRAPHLRERLTQQQKDDLFHRRITTRDLAKELGVSETHLSRTCPGKVPSPYKLAKTERKELLESRKAFRDQLAKKVDAGKLTRKEAVKLACCSDRTFWRHLANARA